MIYFFLVQLMILNGKFLLSLLGTKMKPNDRNKVRSLGEQAILLHYSRDRHVALCRTVETMQIMVARNMVMRALSLLCISGSACKLSSGLESIGKSLAFFNSFPFFDQIKHRYCA